jgi:hypothetical protein
MLVWVRNIGVRRHNVGQPWLGGKTMLGGVRDIGKDIG